MHLQKLGIKLGIKPGDRIATCLPNSPELLDLMLASLEMGAVFCPLNARLPPAVIEEQLLRISPKLIVSSAGYTTRSAPLIDLPPASFLLFTSGSSGTPKIASISQESFWASAKSACVACGLQEGDTWRLSLPLHHVSGLGIVFRCRLANANLGFYDKDRSITHVSYVPAQLYNAWPVYPRLRCVLLGGGPVQEVPAKLPCLVSYGMTETASLFLAGKSPNTLWPLNGKETKLREDGELLVRGDSLFNGYLDGDKLHRPLDPEGWFATNDIAHFDPTLGFRLVGRKDNQFISGGENIQPEEIERELLRLPGVVEALVGPQKHDRFGHRPIALVKTVNGVVDATVLKKCLSERLPSYKIPDAFYPLEEVPGPWLKRNRKKIFDYAF